MDEEALLPLSEAIRAVLARTPGGRTGRLPLADAEGLVLAADVRSDLDMPPFPKAMMDGYALRSADLGRVPAELRVVAFVPAGAVPDREIGPGEAAKIMTGAPMPAGADSVVAVERAEELPGGRVKIRNPVPPGENVAERGRDVWAGDLVARAGWRIGPSAVAALAAAGETAPAVFLPPTVAVMTTGDEVVAPSLRPGPGRIRDSNSPALLARVRRDGAAPTPLGIVPDDLGAIRDAVRRAVGRHDVLLVTGGVSMGDRDLVAAALDAEGFERVFHRVRLKPGKPVLFGVAAGSLVFGLPGNPVSVVATYELLVRPALRRLSGHAVLHRPRVRAVLETAAPRALKREQYLPARLSLRSAGFSVRTIPWEGSADLFGFADANAFLVVPAGGPPPERGAPAEVLVLDGDLDGLLDGGDVG